MQYDKVESYMFFKVGEVNDKYELLIISNMPSNTVQQILEDVYQHINVELDRIITEDDYHDDYYDEEDFNFLERQSTHE